MKRAWRKLICKNNELQLLGTLNGGQSFRWKLIKTHEEERWIGVFCNRVWILKQSDDYISYQVYEAASEGLLNNEQKTEHDDHGATLRNYFQLDLCLEEYYNKWSKVDPYFKMAAEQFYGVRILKQDPVENIFAFICSSNNNISRISSMVEKLASFYGWKICDIDGVTYHAFPAISDLIGPGVEEKLRMNGFGYRAKYIAKTARQILENGGDAWIEKLKTMKYEDAKNELMKLTGIGAKVADCICLMSLGHLQSIPVDTHIYQIAARLYLPKLAKQKTVTEKVYREIGDHFRMLYGPLAGWAHTVLFCADLKKFQVETRQENDASIVNTESKGKKKLKTKQ